MFRFLLSKTKLANHKMDVFIICHDQDILLNLEQDQVFSCLPRYTYLFVGDRPTDKIRHQKNVIICNQLKHNIEQYKNLVSFTAWYAVHKNKLSKNPYVALLEYDSLLSNDFYERTQESLTPTTFVGFNKTMLFSPEFMDLVSSGEQDLLQVVKNDPSFPVFNIYYHDAVPLVEELLKHVYNIDLREFLVKHFISTGDIFWYPVSNAALPIKVFNDFVKWYLPIALKSPELPLIAHVHERCLKVFSVLNQLPQLMVEGVLEHRQLKSHKIEALIL